MTRTLQSGRITTDRGTEPVPWIEETRARGLLPRESQQRDIARRRSSLATASRRAERSGSIAEGREPHQEGPRALWRSRSPSPEDWAAAVRRSFIPDQTPAFYRIGSPGQFCLRAELENFAAQLEASIAREAQTQSQQQTHTFEGIGVGRTVPICAIESDSEDEDDEDEEQQYKPTRTFAGPGSFHTRVYYSVPPDDHPASQSPSFEAQTRRPELGEGFAFDIAVIQDEPENAHYFPDEENNQITFQTASSSLSVSPQPSSATVVSGPNSPISWITSSPAERSPTSPPPPCYVSGPGSPYSDSLLSRLGSITGLDLLGVDFALRDPSQPITAHYRGTAPLLSPRLLSPQISLPPSYHSSPYNPPLALSIITSPQEERPLPDLPEPPEESPAMTHNYFSHPEPSFSRTSHEIARPPVLAMPVAHPTGCDSRRYSAPAVPVHIGYRAPPPPPPPMLHYPSSPITASAPPVPRRPVQPYVAPKPQTMPDTALRLRALSFASRSSMDRPLPPLPPERSQSTESQAISLGEVDSPAESWPTSPVNEREDEEDAVNPPKPPPKPLLHYAYHPTHVSSYTRDVLPLPSSLHPDRHPLPSVIPMPPSPAAFQILAPSFEELLQRLFESGASRIEPTPDVFEVADEAELSAWLRFFKVVPADGESRSARRRLPFRRKNYSQEYRVVLGLQLADPQALSRIESSSSRVPPSPSSSGPPAPPPGATSQSGPNPLLDLPSADDETVLESTWYVPVAFTKRLPCPCSLATLGEALFRAEQESRQTGSRTDENGEKKLWQVIQSHRVRASSFTENGVTNATVTASPSVKTTVSSDVRFEDADLVSRGKTKGLFRKMTMAVADAGSGVGALRTVTRERERERDLRANFVTPFRPTTPT